jgi:predicted DNA-binding transcriptional regulator AlpA
MLSTESNTLDPWLKPKEAAQHAGLSVDNFLKRIRKGTGPRVAGDHKLMRFRTSWVDAWVSNGFQPNTQDQPDAAR